MGHSNDEFSAAQFHCGIEQIFESRNKRLATFKSKSFGCVEFLRHEVAPLMGLVKAIIHVDLLVLFRLVVLNIFESFTHPVALFSIFYVHELDSDFAAVGVFVGFNEISKFPFRFLFQNCALIRV